MTAPPKVPPVDLGNQLLGETPAQVICATVPSPRGQRLTLTIRTPSTTLTVLLNQEDARTWGRLILATASQMSSAGLIVAPAAAVNG